MRFAYQDLHTLSSALLLRAGMAAEMVPTVCDILLLGDILGHDTHGLQLLPQYVAALEDSSMTARGSHRVLTDSKAAAVWDGNYLCGIWLTANALDEAAKRAKEYGIGMVAIRRSHHIACLQAYLTRATDRGLIAFITCSDPANRAVAPFGGVEPLLAPDPIAIGIPAGKQPILIDMSSSITTNGLTGRLAAANQKLRGKWVQDAEGNATDDPKVLQASPPGSLLPVGGLDHGHKGYGLALTVECLTQGLSGFGRKDKVARWTASVLVQVIDTEHFAGAAAFSEQSSFIAETCRASKPRPGVASVKTPGESEGRLRAEAEQKGVLLSDGIIERLARAAASHSLPFPAAIGPG